MANCELLMWVSLMIVVFRALVAGLAYKAKQRDPELLHDQALVEVMPSINNQQVPVSNNRDIHLTSGYQLKIDISQPCLNKRLR